MNKLKELKIMNTLLLIGTVGLWLVIMFDTGCRF